MKLGEEESIKKTTPAPTPPTLQSGERLYLGQVQGPPPQACSPGSAASKILPPGAGSNLPLMKETQVSHGAGFWQPGAGAGELPGWPGLSVSSDKLNF